MSIIIKVLGGLLLFGVFAIHHLQGQEKSAGRIYLEHFRSTEKYELSVRVLGKVEKRYLPVASVEVALYATDVSESNLIGTVLTMDDGTGVYTFSKEQTELTKKTELATYFAVIDDNETFKFKTKEIEIKQVNFEIACFVKDSTNQVIARVWESDSIGNAIPQEDVEISFLVERPLSPLPIGDIKTTDEEGNVSMLFPDDLPSDKEGYIKVLVHIVESDDYGTVEVSEKKLWGIPPIIGDWASKRSLWASGANAPITLLIFINSLIIVVWGVIFYIIFKVFQIRKIGTKIST